MRLDWYPLRALSELCSPCGSIHSAASTSGAPSNDEDIKRVLARPSC